ncbi:hypothetical protein LZK76_02925 [Rhizobium leguminosarum]|nr:hypothetical protein LZK76_02925 [Rhizobium leguminosarum]
MEDSAIHNALKRHDGSVIVKIDAIAASAASLIAMAGDEIEMTLGSADDHRRTAGVRAGKPLSSQKSVKPTGP